MCKKLSSDYKLYYENQNNYNSNTFFFVFGLLMLNLFKLKLLVATDILLVLSSTCLHCPIRVSYIIIMIFTVRQNYNLIIQGSMTM